MLPQAEVTEYFPGQDKAQRAGAYFHAASLGGTLIPLWAPEHLQTCP